MEVDLRLRLSMFWCEHAALRHTTKLAAALFGMGAAAVLIAAVPAIAGFGFAVVASGAWCHWLERHPE